MTEPADCVLAAGHAGPHSDDGAPVHGGVTDPASTSGGPPLGEPLTGSGVYTAPDGRVYAIEVVERCACCGRLADCDCALLHLPAYRPSIIASCPRCGTDLDDEGFSYWCPACQESISAREACMFDEGLPDD